METDVCLQITILSGLVPRLWLIMVSVMQSRSGNGLTVGAKNSGDAVRCVVGKYVL